MVKKIEALMPDLNGKIMAVLGLAFKQGTDDIRESSAGSIVLELLEKEARIKVYDPQAMDNARRLSFAGVPGIESRLFETSDSGSFVESPYKIMYCADEYDAAKGADTLVVLTEWYEFRHLDLRRIAQVVRGKYFFDFRNIYEPEDVLKNGFIYDSIGRPSRRIAHDD